MRIMRGLIWLGWLLGVLMAGPAQAEWRRAESAHFIVFSEGSESRLRERVAELESFDALLRAMVGDAVRENPNKLHVFIVDGHDALNQIRPVREGVEGYYTATAWGIAAFVNGRVQPGDNQILFHEYAHHFMLQHAAGAYPIWYIEGFAEFFMTAQFSRRVTSIGLSSPGRAYSIVEGDWLPMSRVLFGGIDGLSREQGAQFYAQSWLLTHYFLSTPERQQALLRYLTALRDGNDEAALQRATGLTADGLNDELRRYIRGGQIRFRRMVRDAASEEPAIVMSRLPESADDLMVHAAALSVGVARDAGATRLAQIRAAAARHGDDPFARRVLANAEIQLGDAAAAEPLLEALLAASPNDAELLYLRGLCHLAAAESGDDWESQAQAARRWLTRAHRADDNHFQTLYRFAQALRGDPNYESENTTNVLVLAHQLAPQVAEIRMNAAALLIRRGEREWAAEMLRPLAADPHDAALAAAARQLIEQAGRGTETAATEDDE